MHRWLAILLALAACGGAPDLAHDAGAADAIVEQEASTPDAAPDVATDALCCSTADGGSLLACDPSNPFPCYVGSRAEICTEADCAPGATCDGLNGLGVVVACRR